MKWRRDKKEPTMPLAPMFVQLRDNLLKTNPGNLGLPASEDKERPWAVLMEMAYPDAIATLISVADNSTSLYFSNGGGIIGAGEAPEVAEATQFFVARVQAFLPLMTATQAYPLPEAGHVRFHVLTHGGGYTADLLDSEIGQHPLTEMYAIGQLVITRVREQHERRSQERGQG